MSNNPSRSRHDNASQRLHLFGVVIMPRVSRARYAIGDVVRHRIFDFRGVVFDIDPVFANSDDWYESIPEELRPAKDQPFYHLFAENAENSYIAYVSQQNLVSDEAASRLITPPCRSCSARFSDGRYRLRTMHDWAWQANSALCPSGPQLPARPQQGIAGDGQRSVDRQQQHRARAAAANWLVPMKP